MTKIVQKDCLEGFIEDNKRYAVYVLRRRAVPSARDGLKLVHRRILYAEYGLEHAVGRYVKTSKIAGTVIGSLHPHGDASVKDAIPKLTNYFDINIPLLNGDGNFGTIQGDPAADARYTMSKVSPFSLECFFDELKKTKNVVDWLPAYTNEGYEPEYLPLKVPLLLINGIFGIAVGLKCYIPKHSSNDVIDATIKLIKNPNTKVELIPDQCQECEIVENNWKKISNTGTGNFKVRAIIEIGEFQKHPALFVKSTPDFVSLRGIKDDIEDLISDKKMPQIINMYDKTTQEKGTDIQHMNFVIKLKRGSDPNYVRDLLYSANIGLQKTFTVNFEALDGFKPVRFSYKSYLQYFIDFRRMTKFRLYSNLVQNINTQLHQIDFYISIIQNHNIDKVINTIQNYSGDNDSELINILMDLLSDINLTDLQAKFIINNPLKKISKGQLGKYINESNSLHQTIDKYIKLITDDELIDQEIIEELKYFKKKYGSPRKSRIISEAELNNIPEGEFKLVITENNFIKKLDITSSIGYLKNDSAKLILKVDNTKSILLFDEKGKVFKLEVHKIPISEKNSNGIDIRKLLKNATSNINTILYEPVLEKFSSKLSKYFITIVTRKGLIKKMDIEDFLRVPPSGIFYAKLDNDDMVKSVNMINGKADIVVYSDNNALRMNLNDVPHLKRNSKGNNAMSSNELIDGLAIVKADTTHIIVITNKGYINKMSVLALPCIGRFKTPSQIIKLKKGDSIHDILTVNEQDTIHVITKNNKYDYPVSQLTEGSSISSGERIVPTKVDTILKCITLRNRK